ncbi:hypothetical protein ACSQ67_003671 [Phaseolus vulgaris]
MRNRFPDKSAEQWVFGRGSDTSVVAAQEASGTKSVQGDQAPRVPRSAAEEQQQVGLRDASSQQQLADLARHLPHARNGGEGARRCGPRAQGKSACLNFADSVWRLTVPDTTDAEEIRRAAVEAAEAFVAEDVNQQRRSEEIEEPLRLQQEEAMSEDEELHELLMRIANEPLMSPPPCVRDGSGWNDVEIFDAEVSLWNFSI